MDVVEDTMTRRKHKKTQPAGRSLNSTSQLTLEKFHLATVQKLNKILDSKIDATVEIGKKPTKDSKSKKVLIQSPEEEMERLEYLFKLLGSECQSWNIKQQEEEFDQEKMNQMFDSIRSYDYTDDEVKELYDRCKNIMDTNESYKSIIYKNWPHKVLDATLYNKKIQLEKDQAKRTKHLRWSKKKRLIEKTISAGKMKRKGKKRNAGYHKKSGFKNPFSPNFKPSLIKKPQKKLF